MSYYKKQLTREPRKYLPRRYDEHVLKNVISLRISDEELEMLSRSSKISAKSISEIMREAFKIWMADRKRLCVDI
jgi:hypothetical protein